MVQVCKVCNGNISPRSLALKCKQCKSWHHANCLDLSADQLDHYLIESKKDSGDEWICRVCSTTFCSPGSGASFHSAGSAGGYDANMESLKTMLITEFQRLRQELVSSFQRDLSMMSNRMTAVENENKALKSEILQLRANQTSSVQEVISEVEEQKIRAKNIMVFDLAESEDDISCVTAIVGAVAAEAVPLKAVRLGKKRSGVHRPLKVTFANENIATKVLKQSRNIKEKERINVKADLTPGQQNHLKNLRNELQKRTAEGEGDLTIKFIRGLPRIVKKQGNV